MEPKHKRWWGIVFVLVVVAAVILAIFVDGTEQPLGDIISGLFEPNAYRKEGASATRNTANWKLGALLGLPAAGIGAGCLALDAWPPGLLASGGVFLLAAMYAVAFRR